MASCVTTATTAEMISCALFASSLDDFQYNLDTDGNNNNIISNNSNNALMMNQIRQLQAAHQDPLFHFADLDSNSMIGWTEKHPQDWTNEDLLDWIYTVASYGRIGFEGLRAENFQGLEGKHLCNMQEADFIQRDANNGANLFACFTEMLRESQFEGPSELLLDDQTDECNEDFIDAFLAGLDSNVGSPSDELPELLPSIPIFLNPLENDSECQLKWDDYYFKTHTPIKSPLPPETSSNNFCSFSINKIPESGYESAGSDSSCSKTSDTIDFKHIKLEKKTLKSETDHTQKPTRRPGRPRKRQNSGSSTDEGCPSPLKQDHPIKKSKATHLWKFMRSLLDDPEYNPECIRWENKEKGVFRIVPGQSKIIARLWGQRKNNPTMTFDKLSRSLRWCRTFGFLSDVPKDEGFPKKLCFRFGTRAYEWNK